MIDSNLKAVHEQASTGGTAVYNEDDTEDDVEELDKNIDYLSAALTDKDPLDIAIDQSTFCRLSKPANEEKTLELNVQLTIKGRTNIVPLKLEIKHLAEELVQLQGYLTFSRTSFLIGEDEWSSTNILKDNASIYANLFLFKK